jgi:hypothetical protein
MTIRSLFLYPSIARFSGWKIYIQSSQQGDTWARDVLVVDEPILRRVLIPD